MNQVIGILGGGQLGKMLFQAGITTGMQLSFMDKMEEGPVSSVSHNYVVGDISNEEDVIDFGQTVDIISIEIEKVNIHGLKKLNQIGKKVFPQPEIIECIQDKGTQKLFYKEHDIDSSEFFLVESKEDLLKKVENGSISYPFIQKLRRDGYDGRGVVAIKGIADTAKCFDAPSVVEEFIEINKEVAIITCTDQDGNIAIYDPVEMVFHPEANILLYQLGPARISESLTREAKELAIQVTRAFSIVGLLAIEMFYTNDGKLLVNEVAPRPHNSGHHTIEAAMTSQYENHLRAISGLPLGSAQSICNSLLMNLLGSENHNGQVHYEGLAEVMALPGVNVHLYGKKETRPFRKMGHITIISDNYEQMISYYEFINRTLRIISK